MHARYPGKRAAQVALVALLAAWPGVRAATASTRLAGNVWTIDQDASRVTIIDAGHRITFSYAEDTIIRRGSTDRTIHDLRRGDRIVVTLAEEMPDVPRARLIAIAGPPGTAPTRRKSNIFR
jgi:hypothetical protein